MYKVYTLEGGYAMKITSVNVRKIEKEGSRMKGIASVLIDDMFAIHDIRIIEGDNGLFIAMPSRKTAHPVNSEGRAMFQDAILEAYDKAEDPEPATETEE